MFNCKQQMQVIDAAHFVHAQMLLAESFPFIALFPFLHVKLCVYCRGCLPRHSISLARLTDFFWVVFLIVSRHLAFGVVPSVLATLQLGSSLLEN
jgi:hypothetical protein